MVIIVFDTRVEIEFYVRVSNINFSWVKYTFFTDSVKWSFFYKVREVRVWIKILFQTVNSNVFHIVTDGYPYEYAE